VTCRCDFCRTIRRQLAEHETLTAHLRLVPPPATVTVIEPEPFDWAEIE
jgi:hypothetical protein